MLAFKTFEKDSLNKLHFYQDKLNAVYESYEDVEFEIIDHGARSRIIGIGQQSGAIYAADFYQGGQWNGQFKQIGLDETKWNNLKDRQPKAIKGGQ